MVTAFPFRGDVARGGGDDDVDVEGEGADLDLVFGATTVGVPMIVVEPTFR
jgi:hypothetical protein